MPTKATVVRSLSPKRVCNVFLDADKAFYDHWKDSCSDKAVAAEDCVKAKMNDTLILTAEMFRTDAMLRDVLELTIAGTNIIMNDFDLKIDDGEDIEDALDMYKSFLEDLPQPRVGICLNHLFTHTNMRPSRGFPIRKFGISHGAEAVPSANMKPGGMCGVDGSNSGLSSSTIGEDLFVRRVQRDIVHMVGANDNSQVDCGGDFLMQGVLDIATEAKLSFCSQWDIFQSIQGLVEESDQSSTRPEWCFGPASASPTPPPNFGEPDAACMDSPDARYEPGGVGRNYTGLPCSVFVGRCDNPIYEVEIPNLKEACPKSCGECNLAPTSSPTFTPTPSPTFQIVSRICRKDEYDVTDSSKDETPNNAITTLEGKTVDQCVNSCAEEPKCTAFNHNVASLQCELKFSDFATNDLVVQPGIASTWKYYRMTEDCRGECPDNVLERFVKHSHMKDQDAGHRIKRIPNVNKKTCAKKCEQRTACFAFNHRQNNPGQWEFACQLLEAPDVFDFTYHTATAQENMWRYYRMKSSCANEKYDMLLEERQAAGMTAVATASFVVPVTLAAAFALVAIAAFFKARHDGKKNKVQAASQVEDFQNSD